MRVKADVQMLKQIPLFAGCQDTHLQVLAFSSDRVEIPEGRLLLKKGTRGAAGFVVLEGEAEVYDDANGAGNVLARIGTCVFLGELSMITDAAYGITVKAVSMLAAQRIERELFLRVAAEFPEFSLQVMENLSSKLGRSMAELGEVRGRFN